MKYFTQKESNKNKQQPTKNLCYEADLTQRNMLKIKEYGKVMVGSMQVMIAIPNQQKTRWIAVRVPFWSDSNLQRNATTEIALLQLLHCEINSMQYLTVPKGRKKKKDGKTRTGEDNDGDDHLFQFLDPKQTM